MSDPLPTFIALPVISQPMISHLIAQGVPPVAGIAGQTDVLKRVAGKIGTDGWFDADPDGSGHVAILVCAFPDDPVDIAVWQPRTARLGSYFGRAFALGQDQIDSAATYFAEGGLLVHRSPLDWLRAGRKGIVIMRPEWAAERLRNVPRLIAADVGHGRELRRLLTPKIPEIFVPVREREAA
jgi:hypothetical protein